MGALGTGNGVPLAAAVGGGVMRGGGAAGGGASPPQATMQETRNVATQAGRRESIDALGGAGEKGARRA